MAAANESQGLKIAVAAFVTLTTVALAVTSYFLYSAYSRSEAQLESERDKLTKAQKVASDAVNQYDEFRKLAGARAEEFDTAKAEVGTFFKKNSDRINNLVTATNAAIQKAQQAGAESKDLEEARARVQTIVYSYQSEPNKNFISTLDRLTELLENISLLSTEMSSNYVGLRKSLESTTSVAKQANDIQAKAASDSKADLEAEHNKHEQLRQELLTKVDQLQNDNEKKTTQIANLETEKRQLKDDSDRKLDLANAIIREQRDVLDKSENVLDKPDGYITFVDLERNEVQVNINRRQGARPQMKMTVFSANSPGVPTEKPKGNIQLIQVGEQYSIAHIDKMVNEIDPIRVGDIVYSPAWSPEEPMRFALIGKIDVNRDGKDDCQDLKRMIEEAGGIVDYDLPPPNHGKESGKLSARISWYVTDERMPLREVFEARTDAGLAAQAQFDKRFGQAIKEARSEGIRPMPLGRLLAYFGYEMGTPVVGRTEAVNIPAMLRLVQPRKKAAEPKIETDSSKAGAEPANAKPEAEAAKPEPEAAKPAEEPKS
ncbi:MAG: coiled-coil domain-containing protein [Isosphaeraceae bacterium]